MVTKADETKERAARGSGSIALDPATGKWMGRPSLVRRDGSRYRPKVYGRTPDECRKNMNRVREEFNNSREAKHATGKLTLEQWWDEWRTEVTTNRPSTLATYRSIMKVWVLPEIGKRQLARLTDEDLQRVVDECHKVRSSSTARGVHSVLSALFRDARKRKRITDDPMFYVEKPELVEYEGDALSIQEAMRLIKTDPEDVYEALWTVALLTGMRRGELLGLQWEDVDRYIHVRWQLVRLYEVDGMRKAYRERVRHVTGGLYLAPVKSKKGVRIVPVTGMLKQALDNWRERTGGTGFVFLRPDGQPFQPPRILEPWAAALHREGIHRMIRFHDIRHTAVNFMYEAGIKERVISTLVGHSKIATSRGYRTREIESELSAAMEELEAVVQKGDVKAVEAAEAKFREAAGIKDPIPEVVVEQWDREDPLYVWSTGEDDIVDAEVIEDDEAA